MEALKLLVSAEIYADAEGIVPVSAAIGDAAKKAYVAIAKAEGRHG